MSVTMPSEVNKVIAVTEGEEKSKEEQSQEEQNLWRNARGL
jgi:hypothetical protein